MANLTRSAKSSIDWTDYDLKSYNINLVSQSPHEFFGVQVFPHPTVDAELLTNLEADTMQNDRNAELVNLLDLASHSSVVDFVVELLKTTGYARRNRVVRTRRESSLLVCGEYCQAKTDVSLVDRELHDTILLLIQETECPEDNEPIRDTRAQLVAEALAAFTQNNINRQLADLPVVDDKVMPGIVMEGTSPIFFKIPVTEELSTHVRHGTYPLTPTTVTFCFPPVPQLPNRRSDGMKPLDSRREILQCYEAFKTVVGI